MFRLKTPVSIVLILFSYVVQPCLAADKVLGEKLAANCAGCHGPKGQSSSVQWPNLAGQTSTYLINQLSAFRTGQRNNPSMQAMKATLKDDDIRSLAFYYASQPTMSSVGNETLANKGENKAAICLGCHGALGEGHGIFPRLAGQHADYLLNQLKAFKTGIRINGLKSGTRLSDPMQTIASRLSEADMSEIAAYFAALK